MTAEPSPVDPATRTVAGDDRALAFRFGVALGQLSRLRLGVPSMVVFLATAFAAGVGWGAMLLGTLCLAAGVASASASNDIEDRKADLLAGKSRRPLVTGELTVEHARRYARATGIVALLAAVPMRRPASVPIAAVMLVLAWLYSARPVRLKARSFLGTVDLAAAYLAVPVALGLAQSDDPPRTATMVPAIAGIVVAAQGVIWHKDVVDAPTDAATGAITPVVSHGLARLARWSTAIVVVGIAAAAVALGRWAPLLVAPAAWLVWATLRIARGYTTDRAMAARWALTSVAAVIGMGLTMT